jgi:SAM-dependent methyltransferase
MDAVISAQAFHWFASARALAEIRRVLKPGGSLGLVWNVRDERVDWVAALTEIMAPFAGSAPRYHTGLWRDVFAAPGFGPLRERRFPHQHMGPPEVVILDRVLSVSFIAALPPTEQEKIAERVRHVIESFPATANQQQVAFPYQTVAYDCTKLS